MIHVYLIILLLGREEEEAAFFVLFCARMRGQAGDGDCLLLYNESNEQPPREVVNLPVPASLTSKVS
jgi:hypothetical protein